MKCDYQFCHKKRPKWNKLSTILLTRRNPFWVDVEQVLQRGGDTRRKDQVFPIDTTLPLLLSPPALRKFAPGARSQKIQDMPI